jgi:hypothetical protein
MAVDLRRKHGRRSLLAKDVGAYLAHLEDTIDFLRTELSRSATRTGRLVREAYDHGHQEGRSFERRLHHD